MSTPINKDGLVWTFFLERIERETERSMFFVAKDGERVEMLTDFIILEWIPDENKEITLVVAIMSQVGQSKVCTKAKIRASRRKIEELREGFAVLGLK